MVIRYWDHLAKPLEITQEPLDLPKEAQGLLGSLGVDYPAEFLAMTEEQRAEYHRERLARWTAGGELPGDKGPSDSS